MKKAYVNYVTIEMLNWTTRDNNTFVTMYLTYITAFGCNPLELPLNEFHPAHEFLIYFHTWRNLLSLNVSRSLPIIYRLYSTNYISSLFTVVIVINKRIVINKIGITFQLLNGSLLNRNILILYFVVFVQTRIRLENKEWLSKYSLIVLDGPQR